MSRSQATILTNMCLIEDDHGNIVMQIRDSKRYSWSGAALPGGHIEAHEGLVESVIREVKEEIGLPGRMCLRWSWPMTCSTSCACLKRINSLNFSIVSVLKMTLSENFGNNMNYLFK